MNQYVDCLSTMIRKTMKEINGCEIEKHKIWEELHSPNISYLAYINLTDRYNEIQKKVNNLESKNDAYTIAREEIMDIGFKNNKETKLPPTIYTVVLKIGEEIFSPIICITVKDAVRTRKEIFSKYCLEKNIKLQNGNDFDDYEKVVWANSVERVCCYIFESDVYG